MRALAGPGAPQKLTPDVRAFIEVRFSQIYKETHYNYSTLIRDEIKKIFRKDISSESLRPVFNELKKIEAQFGDLLLVINDQYKRFCHLDSSQGLLFGRPG